MSQVSSRPFIPVGSFQTPKEAEAAAKAMSKDPNTPGVWIPCRGKAGDKTKLAIVRQS